MNNLACVLADDFSCCVGNFQIPCRLHFPFLKSCYLVPMVEFLSLRDSLNQYFWEVCASSFPQLWCHIARLEEQYSFKATCVFLSCCLGTPSTVLRMGFGNWAALKTKMGEKLYSFIVPSLLWSLMLHTSKQGRSKVSWSSKATNCPKAMIAMGLTSSSKLFNVYRMLLSSVLLEVLVRGAGICAGKEIYKCI